MSTPIRPVTRRLLRTVSCAVVLAALLGPAVSVAWTEAAIPQRARRALGILDLPAMTLRPSDAREDGYGYIGWEWTFAEYVSAEATDRMDQAAVSALLERCGFRRSYHGEIALPNYPGEADGGVVRRIESLVTEYADADGAAAAVAFETDEGRYAGDSHYVDWAYEPIPAAETFGDASVTRRYRGYPEASADHFEGIQVVFRLGNLVGEVYIQDFRARRPTLAELREMATTFVARIEEVRGQGSGLSGLALRLKPDGEPPLRRSFDRYRRYHGETIPIFGEAAKDVARRDAAYADAVDVYRVTQQVVAGDALEQDDPLYFAELYRFSSAEAAAEWLGNAALALSDDYEAMLPVEDARRFGDESAVFAVDVVLGDQTMRGAVVFARVGAIVARLQLTATPSLSPTAVEELMDAQVACLAAGVCREPVAVPEELARLIADRGRGSAEEDGGRPALVDGRYQLPQDEDAIVIEAVVSNLLVAPAYQSGYEVKIDASGHAEATIYPEGSRGGADGGAPTADAEEITVELGEEGLQRLLTDLDARGFFALPPPQRTAGGGGTVSEITVALADGTWDVSICCLATTDQQERFAAIQQAIADAVGIEPPSG